MFSSVGSLYCCVRTKLHPHTASSVWFLTLLGILRRHDFNPHSFIFKINTLMFISCLTDTKRICPVLWLSLWLLGWTNVYKKRSNFADRSSSCFACLQSLEWSSQYQGCLLHQFDIRVSVRVRYRMFCELRGRVKGLCSKRERHKNISHRS